MRYSIILLALCSILSATGQKIFTKTGEISFHSDAPMEKIEATNSKATSVIDLESGEMQWSVLIKAFHFEKSLMEEHFNENYMESSKFPKALFKGRIDNLSEIDLNKEGTYEAQVSGQLTIHGVSNEVSTTATFAVSGGQIKGTSTFVVAVADYDIEIPSVVSDNIAKEVEIQVVADYEKLEK